MYSIRDSKGDGNLITKINISDKQKLISWELITWTYHGTAQERMSRYQKNHSIWIAEDILKTFLKVTNTQNEYKFSLSNCHLIQPRAYLSHFVPREIQGVYKRWFWTSTGRRPCDYVNDAKNHCQDEQAVFPNLHTLIVPDNL